MRPSAEPAAMSPLRAAFTMLLAASATLLVWRVAWVSEDAFITLRYVSNVFHGLGPVFNAGEYVQGYTHSLWLLVLVVGGAFVSDLIYLTVGLGLLLTAAGIFVMTRTLLRLGGASIHGGLAAVLFALLCVSSDAWLSFQTGGLENALTHLLMIVLASEVVLREPPRLFVVTFLGALLVLNRPDHAVFFLPFALVLLTKLREPRARRDVALGALPLVAWIAFAIATYGDLVPNTARAKVGIFPTWWVGVVQGFTYLWDWLSHEPLACVSGLALLVFATIHARTSMTRAYVVGLWLQIAYVVSVGGDFMRGRFLLVTFVGSLAIGTAALTRWLREREAPARWSIALVAAVSIVAAGSFGMSTEVQKKGVPRSGIVDERLYYPGYSLASYRALGRLENPYLDLTLADRLREYAIACGPVVVHARNPGTLAYFAGPAVSVIDTLGLTDAFIARLPRRALLRKRPRVGHPDKHIPLSYLAKREDIAFLLGWRAAVGSKACGFARHTNAYLDSTETMTHHELFPRLDDDASGS